MHNYKILDKEQTAVLLAAAKNGDSAAGSQLVEANSPLIKSLVKRYIGKGVEYDDLYQLGCLGFVKAINKYDDKFGVKFTTYAVPLIMGEIKRFLRDDGTIKVSRSVKGLYVKIKRYLALNQAVEAPTIDDLAKHFEVPREDIIYAMEASHLPISLFEKNGGEGDGPSLHERIAGSDSEHLVDNIMLTNLLSSLTVRERKIIMLRYFRNATQSEVAKRMGISQVQVSRIEQRVLKDFKSHFMADEAASE